MTTTPSPEALVLKDCAHCGSADVELTGIPGCRYVKCNNCGISTDDTSEERARAAWNRRPTPTDSGDEALVERVARDMRGAYGLYEGDVIVPWDRARPELKEAWLCCARAAIQAIPAPATDAGQSADSLVEQIIAFLRDDQEWGLLKNWSRFEFANEIERKFLPKSPSAGEEA